MFRKAVAISGLFLAAVWLAAPAVSGENGQKPKLPDPGSPEAEMMKKCEAYATPGPHHKQLERLAGDWSAVVKFWMDPSGEPSVSKGKATYKWILGGRYLQEEFEGEANGQPFSGRGLLAYNNNRKQYQGTWIDSMSTGVYSSTGTCDSSGRTLTMHGEMDDPVSGSVLKTREVTRMESDSKVIFEMYSIGDGGKETKMMEITYTRA